MGVAGRTLASEVAQPARPAGWSEVLRTAHLVTADSGAAEELAVAACVRAGRSSSWRGSRWGPTWWGRAGSDARRLVLTPAAPLVRWLVPQPPRIRTVPEHSDPFLRAYRALSPRRRALLVLRVADGLDQRAAAQILGLPAERAAAETLAALDVLRAPLADRPPAGGTDAARVAAPAIELDLGEARAAPRAGDDVGAADRVEEIDPVDPADPTVHALRRLFADLEAHPPVTADPGRRVLAAAARYRRRRWSAVAACATVVLLLVTGGTLAARQAARAEAARAAQARERAREALLHPVVLGSDLSTWPTRGSHAGDAALLDQVRRRVGPGVGLPFVGRVGDLDMALVYASAADRTRLYVLHGPAGSPPAGWAEDDGLPPVFDVPVLSAAIRDGNGLVHLVVVTLSSGVSAAWSPAPVMGDDATVARDYRAFRLEDGAGTAVTRGEPRRFALRLRTGSATSIGVFDVRSPDLTPVDTATERLPVAVQRAPSCAGFAVADDAPALVDEALGRAWLSPGDVTGVRQLWCRRTGDVSAVAMSLSATHGPDILCYEAAVRTDAGLGFDRLCWPVPRGRAGSYPFVVPRPPDEDTAAMHAITVWAPGARRVEVRATLEDDRLLAASPVATDGYARVMVPIDLTNGPAEGLVVVLRDAAGREVDQLPAEHDVGDGWGDYADGPVLGPQG